MTLENKAMEQIVELDRGNWIKVPEKEGNKFINDSYNFSISPERISYSPAIEKVGNELGINYKNTSKDSLGREFVGNNNWSESLRMAQALGVNGPILKEKVDYLHLLYLGSQKKIKVWDVLGKQIDSKLCEKYLMDTIETKGDWRGEWIDNDFKTNEKGLEVHYNHIFDQEGNIINYKSEVLDKNTLMIDKQIDIIDFLTKNNTSQGNVHKDVKSGKFYSWFPRDDNNSVVWFIVDSGGAVLYCYGNPSDGSSSLGVRAVKIE